MNTTIAIRTLSGLTVFCALSFIAKAAAATLSPTADTGTASWYGEDHRGRLMANGRPFNPERLTAASWFYPLGTRVVVSLRSPGEPVHRVVVRITDRGPAMDLVRAGRKIDLSEAAFRRLAAPDVGLVAVKVERLSRRQARDGHGAGRS